MPLIYSSRSRRAKRVNFLHNFVRIFYIFSACGTMPMQLQAESIKKLPGTVGSTARSWIPISRSQANLVSATSLISREHIESTLYWHQDSVQAIRTN
jgi:hypothetical protein